MKTILYILGEAHSGKSEAAKHLQKVGFTEIALADPMKRFLMELYGFSEDQLWGPSASRNQQDPRFLHRAKGSLGTTYSGGDPSNKMPNPPEDEYLSARLALQTLGEAMRGCYSQTWVRKLFETFGELEKGGMGYVPTQGLFGDGHPVFGRMPEPLGPYFDFLVPDVRHWNEHDALKEAGAKGFRIRAPFQGEGLSPKLAQHRSETEQREIPDDELDAVIVNDGTLEELYAKIDAFLEEHTTDS